LGVLILRLLPGFGPFARWLLVARGCLTFGRWRYVSGSGFRLLDLGRRCVGYDCAARHGGSKVSEP
jgi:hypothetical protein